MIIRIFFTYACFQGQFDWQAHWERRLSDAVCDWAGKSD